MSDMQINQVLQQMRSMAALAEGRTPSVEVGGGEKPDFSNLLKNSIDGVNQVQQTSAQMAHSFEMGDPSVSLSEVMISAQKSSVSFQAMTQVRNKLISAYQEVMNMQV